MILGHKSHVSSLGRKEHMALISKVGAECIPCTAC